MYISMFRFPSSIVFVTGHPVMLRSLRDSAAQAQNALPAGRCSLDYGAMGGRPLRWFLITEIPAVIILVVSTVVAVLYYNGQSQVIADDTIIATHFSWATGCGDRFGSYDSTSSYHTSVTYAPLMTMALCLAIADFTPIYQRPLVAGAVA